MLDVDSVFPFLLDRGLIDLAWIIDGTLTIRSIPRRNRNLQVEGPEGRGYLIKQPELSAHGGHATLRCESMFHEFCREEPAASALTLFLPRLVHSLDEEARLVFELISDAIPLQIRPAAQGGRDHDMKAARALGHALATVHRVFRQVDLDRDPRMDWLPRTLPSILKFHQPGPEKRAGMSRAHLEILRVLQAHPGFGDHLDRSTRSWRPQTLIHGDIRFDNVLVRPPRAEDEGDAVALWLVDWEMVQIGDPAWDLAGALQDFLVIWVSSMPLSEGLSSEEMTARARVPLDDLRIASRALWAGYRAVAGLDVAEAAGLLRRAVAFAAVRLIQSAFEFAAESDQLVGEPVLLLQIGANLLGDPELGQVQLFGIPPGSVAT
jgi:hypothetical protein